MDNFKVILLDQLSTSPRWLKFEQPTEIITASRLDEVGRSLERLQEHNAAGHYAAGFITYEAAAGLSPDLKCHQHKPGLPLLQFGVYDNAEEFDLKPSATL